jgi:O-antigen ligase
MKIKKSTLKKNLILFAVFFTFGGYYAALMVVTNILGSDSSRLLTVPLRVLIVGALILSAIIGKNKRYDTAILFFLMFSFFYVARTVLSLAEGSNLYRPPLEFLFYFLSFVFFPVLAFGRIKVSPSEYHKILIVFIYASILVAAVTTIYYGTYLGQAARISGAVARGGNYISPLSLSYSAVLGIGIGVAALLSGRVSRHVRFLALCSVVGCFIPFFLGASRGSIIALGFSVAFVVFYDRNVQRKSALIILILLVSALLLYAQNFLGTGVFDRFSSIGSDIQSDSSAAIRLVVWRESFSQFLEDPVFGNSLQANAFGGSPHNILIEALISTGISGSIPLVAFFAIVFSRCARIVKVEPEASWVVVPFIQGFIAGMFSGSICSAAWLFLGAALVFGWKPEPGKPSRALELKQ